MSITHLGSVLVFTAMLLMATRCARGTFVLAARERDRRAHAAAALVTAELTGGHLEKTLDPEERLIINGNGCDLTDLEVLTYTAAPGSPPGRTAHRENLAFDEKWAVPGPSDPAPVEDIKWILWWTCPYRYRWRLTVHGRHRRTLKPVARPAGSAAHTDSPLTYLRGTAWPYTFTTANPRRSRPPAPPPDEEDPTEVPGTSADDWDITASQPEPGRIAVTVTARPRLIGCGPPSRGV